MLQDLKSQTDVALASHVLHLAKSVKKHLNEKQQKEFDRIEQRFQDMEFVGEADLMRAKKAAEVKEY